MRYTRRQFGALAAGTAIVGAGCLGGSDLDEDDLLEVPVAGDPEADVTVTVYEDFTCPGCRQFKANTYPSIREAYIDPEHIRYEHRDFPGVTDSDWSYPVASAARSVQDHEGDDAFFQFSRAIYEFQEQYSLEVIEEVAAAVDADGEQTRTDADEVTYEDGLEADRAYGEEQDVRGTPWVFVDGDHVEDASADGVASAIENAMQ